ncbi:hypothetical protein [Haloparvum sedimenti]|uniref:hypothetical protein n=1 Tax=Haloparvum sedimenti TaxID=1678448 RepID=UPI00071E9264|nr:hypothetical protein [Haloparvum sedimenti]
MTRVPSVGGGQGSQAFAPWDEAETFGESDVSVSLTGTQIAGESVGLLSQTADFAVNIERDSVGTASDTISPDVSEVEVLEVEESLYVNDCSGEGRLYVDGNLTDTATSDGDTVSTSQDVSDQSSINLTLEVEMTSSDSTYSSINLNGSSAQLFAKNGSVTIEWPAPPDVYRWDAASFQISEDGETVGVFIEENDGTGWTEIAGPISPGDQIAAHPNSQVRFRVELSRTDRSNNPALDAIYRRYIAAPA